MARVTISTPTELEELPERLERSARVALSVALEETVARAKSDSAMPVNTGTGRRSIATADIERTATGLSSGVISAGPAAAYMATMDSGRRPGAPGPSSIQLLRSPGMRDVKGEASERGGWVNRQMREQVEALARDYEERYIARRGLRTTKSGKTATRQVTTRQRLRFLRKARFVVARGVASSIHTRGIFARRFVSRHTGFLAQRFGERFGEQIARKS